MYYTSLKIGITTYAIYQGFSESVTRTMVFVVLVTANIFLNLINRSFYFSLWTTLHYKNNLVGYIIGLTVGLSLLLL